MSNVNIWGSAEQSAKTTPLVTLNNYVRKSGDIMTGDLNLGGNKVINVGTPEIDSDVSTKGFVEHLCSETRTYADRISTAFIHKGGEEVIAEPLKVGTKNNQSVELIKNGRVYLMLEDGVKLNDDLNLQQHRIINMHEPTENGDAVTKNFVDSIKTELRAYIDSLNDTCLHRAGDAEAIGALFLGSNDNIPVIIICNSQRYIALYRDTVTMLRNVDMSNKNITNLRNPIHDLDAANRRFVLEKCNTKNCTGLIPSNPIWSGFTITSSSTEQDVKNIFIADSSWVSAEETDSWIQIRCPFPVKLWGIQLCGVIDRFINGEVTQNFTIKGSRNRTQWDVIGNSFTLLTNPGSYPRVIMSREKFYIHLVININMPDIPAYRQYSFHFLSDTPVQTEIANFQMYVYNS